jgi:hypothetical protein
VHTFSVTWCCDTTLSILTTKEPLGEVYCMTYRKGETAVDVIYLTWSHSNYRQSEWKLRKKKEKTNALRKWKHKSNALHIGICMVTVFLMYQPNQT